MHSLLAALVFAVLATFAAAEPTTLKEVFAQEASWQVALPPKGADPISFNRSSLFATETAAAFLGRIGNGRSDAERKAASEIVRANRATLDPVLAAAEPFDAARVKALRAALDRIAAAKSAAPSDLAEVARVLTAVR